MDGADRSLEDAEVAVRQAKRYASILQRAPLAIVEYTGDLTIVGWSDAAERLLGYAREEAVGRRVDELLPVPEGGWRRLLDEDQGEGRRFRHSRKDGSTTTIEWLHERLRGERGEVSGAVCFGQDVTARIEEACRHKEHETLLRAITQNLPVIVWAIGKDGIFTFHEGKALEQAGLRQGQHIGKNVFDLYPVENGNDLQRALAGETLHGESEGHGCFWESWEIPLRDEQGEVRAVVGVTLDVTPGKRTEQELRAKLDLIERQQQVIRDLSTPILQVWDGVLTLPMIGVVDSSRTAEVMDSLLDAVARTRTRYAILDLTGVEVVDTKTAGYLVELVRAIRLLGAEGIITGLRPTVAQTIVALGLDLADITTLSNLRAGLKHCIARMRQVGEGQAQPGPAPRR